MPDSDTFPEKLRLGQRSGLPDAIACMRAQYPRSTWTTHPNYADLASFWAGVHASLRREAEMLAALTRDYREGDLPASGFQKRFMPALAHHLQHLEGHHQIEDWQYFPRFRALDQRLVAGFDLLENDHEIIHEELLRAAASARTFIQALAGSSSVARRAADRYADDADRLLALLDRHLDDEEDLVMPAILAYGERPLR